MKTAAQRSSSSRASHAGAAFSERIARNRAAVELALRTSRLRKYQSPALLALHRTLEPRVRSNLRGRVLDVGCGVMPFRQLIETVASQYRSLDVDKRVPEVDFVSDAQDMSGIPPASFDGVLCSEVLEHVPEPKRVLGECFRVLAPGGSLVLTVPFLSRLHEEPHDYYRYTTHGLNILLEQAGFSVREIVPTGSIVSFLGHQLSTALVCGTWHIPVVKTLVFWWSALLITIPAERLDRLLRISARFPLGYVVVAHKPGKAP